MITSLCWSAAQCCAKSNCFLICHNASSWPLWSVFAVGWEPLTHRHMYCLMNTKKLNCKIYKTPVCVHFYTYAVYSTPANTEATHGYTPHYPPAFFSPSDMTSTNQTFLAAANHPPCQLSSRPASQWVVVKGRCWHKIKWNTPTGLQRAGS